MKTMLFLILFSISGSTLADAQKHDYDTDRMRFNAGRNAVKHCASSLVSNYGICEYRALWHPNDVLLDDIPEEMEAGAKYEGMIYAVSVFQREEGSNGHKAGEGMLLSNAHIIAQYVMHFNPNDVKGREFSNRFGINYVYFRTTFLSAARHDMCIKDRGLTTEVENCRAIEKMFDNMASSAH